MTGIKFCDPPPVPTAKGNSKWHAVIAELKERPNEWAKIKTANSAQAAANLAGNVRRGYGLWSPAGSFETTRRGCDVYARYVGGAA